MTYTVQEIKDRAVWDNFFLNTSPTSLFQSWVWGEVQNSIQSQTTRFGLYSGATLLGIFQLVIVRAKRGSFVHLRHGPVLVKQDPTLWNEITTFLVDYAKKNHALFFRISPLISLEHEEQLVKMGYKPAPIHAMDAEYCWVLDLNPSEEELLKNMRKTTRYEIRKAQSMGVEVVASTKSSDLEHFFTLYNETAKRQGFVGHKGIKEEFALFSAENETLLYLGTYNNEIVSAAIILYTGTQGIYHHGASLSNKIPASYLIQWEAIKEAKRRGMRQYNFWGIAPTDVENHPWQGITLFKKGFGGKEQRFLHAHDYPVSRLYVLPNLIETYRRIKKGY